VRPASIASAGWREPRSRDSDDTSGESLGDPRFRALLADRDWEALPPAIRCRFSRRLADGGTIVYAGRVIETRMSRLGWALAQAVRPIGGPLPIGRDHDVAAVVAVTEDVAGGGQVWTRIYARRSGFPHVIHSAKRFAGRTGLEEHVGFGVGMALTTHVVDSKLVFRSAGYFVHALGRSFALPAWLSPGALAVTHAALADGWFSFTLDLHHPRFGALIRQTAVFREAGT
jgi:Domain of unknown function (DUF4166)